MLLAWLCSLGLGVATLNSDGGLTASDGLRVLIGDTGQIQIYSNSKEQFFTFGGVPGPTSQPDIDNGIYLVIGTTGPVVGPYHTNFTGSTAWFDEWNTTAAASGSTTGSGTVTLDLDYSYGAATYAAHITYVYDELTEFVTMSIQLTVTNNIYPLKLYLAYDSLLGGSDNGPSVYAPTPIPTLGVYSTGLNPTYEALRYRSGLQWTNHYAGRNNCLFHRWLDAPACPAGVALDKAGDYGTFADPGTTDNGFGVEWPLGVTGTVSSVINASNDLIFLAYLPELRGSLTLDTIASGASTPLDFSIDNTPKNERHTNIGFTSNFPAGLTLANTTTTNTCGGVLTDALGASLNTGDTGIKLAGGVLPTGTPACDVSVNVTASNGTTGTTTINFAAANVSAVTGALNDTSPDTLQVLPTPPVVTLATPASISSATAQAAYPVSGTCSNNGVTVSVSVGSVNGTTSCSGSAFSTTLDVSALVDGVYTASASQTNAGGTGSASKSVRKQTAVTLTKAFGTSPIASGGTSTLVFTLTNGPSGLPQSGLTFTDTFPANLTVADVTTSTTCTAATRQNDGGGAIAAGNTGVKVVAASFSGASCTVTFDVTSTNATGATVGRANGAAQVVATAPVSYVGGTQTLQVLPTPPVVTLNAPTGITSANVTAYPVSGACTNGSGLVSVSVGAVNTSTPCSGTFATTLDVFAIADGPSVSVSASQTNAGGIGTDSTTTTKSTSAPFVTGVVTSVPDGVYQAGDSIDVTLTLSEVVTPTAVTIMLNSGALLVLNCATSCTGNYVIAPGENAAILDVSSVTGTLSDGTNSNSSLSPGNNLSVAHTIGVDTLAPAAPTLTLTTTTASGTGEPGAAVGVSEGGALLCQATVASDGTFSCLLTLAPGPHTMTALQTDAAGNGSPPSSAALITVDASAPPPPLIDSPGEGAVNPTQVSGSAQAGTHVTVREGSVVLCTATAGADNTFSCAITDLSVGDHAITATAAFAGGPNSPLSTAVHFTITSAGSGGAADGAMDQTNIGDIAGDLKAKKKAGCSCASDPTYGEVTLIGLLLLCAARGRTRVRRLR